MIKFKHVGEFRNILSFFKRNERSRIHDILSHYGSYGVSALAANTPKDTGATADSWSYEIKSSFGRHSLIFKNSSVTKNNTPIVIMLQYGYGTRHGGYVQGIDFINSSIQPIFEDILNKAWQEVVDG